MPTEDYDEYDDVDEVEEIDDVDEVEEVDEVDEVEEASGTEDEAARGRRQLERGAVSRFSDRLTGGAARPGEEDVKRSPFVMVMTGVIIGLTLLALIFGFMILTASERRSYEAALADLKAAKFKEAEQRYMSFLQAYPKSEYSDAARIGLHTARVRMYTAKDSYTAEPVKEGLHQLEELIRVCRDLEGFEEEHENVRRYAERLARVGAIVAESKRLQEPLDHSMAATAIMERFSGPDGVPISIADDLRQLQRKAAAEILKQDVLTDAMAEIRGHLEDGDTLSALESRQNLIDSYEVLSDDKDVTDVLQQILKAEQDLTTYEDIGQDASTEEIRSSDRTPASLTLRTQATVDQVSMGQLVFGLGVDSCYGLDSETGEPVWKRSVGTNPPFSPQLVEASEPALLIYHTGLKELLLLTQKTGSLIWRQKIPVRPSGEPLIFGGHIYLTTTSGELWKLSVTNGRAISRVRFNQPVIGPPTVTRSEDYMVISGDQSVVYTLSISPLKCVAVSYVEHRLGSVETPIMALGNMLLLCDNDTADEARLRILNLNEQTGQLTVHYTDSVSGQVRDPSLTLRGTQLFVPSTPQRVTAFTVNDSPDADPPISRIGANQLESGTSAPIHLLAGPGGQLWMASEALRRFRVRTNSLELETGSVAEGLHLQPIQFRNQNVYLTTNEAYSSSVFFTKADPETMTGHWRTVVGANIVAAGASNSGQSVLAIGDFGEVFRVPVQSIESGDFVLDSITRFRIPDGLKDPVGGLRLNDGRLAAYCGGDEPAAWTITTSGQLEQKWPLVQPAVVPPVALDAGIVFAMQGRLHLTGRRRGRVEDYRAAQGINDETSWKSLVAINENQVLAIDSSNNAVRVEYRDSPRPHLYEVSSTRLEFPLEVRPTAAGDLLMAVTPDGKLVAFAAATLEALGQADLGAVAGRPPFVSGERVFVEVARRQLKVFTRSGNLTQTAEVPLDGRFLVGTPVQTADDRFVACFSDGRIMLLDSDGGATEKIIELGQEMKIGPVKVDDHLIVVGVDGSLYNIEDILE